ncbi:MAG: hypothetical protein MUP58_02465 [Candidatus Nanohaloarchaeota archaeon QJJ-9]|nr:hypothetical protein [Candidatus Nanohaloarchaeota archaeon QJJ-9]
MEAKGLTTRGLWIAVMVALALFAGGVVAAVMLRTASGMDLCAFYYDLIGPIMDIVNSIPFTESAKPPCPFG